MSKMTVAELRGLGSRGGRRGFTALGGAWHHPAFALRFGKLIRIRLTYAKSPKTAKTNAKKILTEAARAAGCGMPVRHTVEHGIPLYYVEVLNPNTAAKIERTVTRHPRVKQVKVADRTKEAQK